MSEGTASTSSPSAGLHDEALSSSSSSTESTEHGCSAREDLVTDLSSDEDTDELVTSSSTASQPDSSSSTASQPQSSSGASCKERSSSSTASQPQSSSGTSSSGSASSSRSSSSDSVSSDPRGAVQARETIEEHIRRHDYPAHISSCNSCRYWHNKAKWEKQAVFEDTQAGQEVTWLLHKNGYLGCSLCKAARKDNVFGKCMAGARLCNILRHGNHLPKQICGKLPLVGDHMEALQQWNNKAQTASKGSTDTVDQLNFTVTYAHILFQRTLIKVGGSQRDFKRWALAASLAGADSLASMNGRRVSGQLAKVMAQHETEVTGKLLRASVMAGVSADGRELVVAVRLSMVLWSWPRGLPKESQNP